MKIAFLGQTHLSRTLADAAEIKGFEIAKEQDSDIIFVAPDVYDHSNLCAVDELMAHAIGFPASIPVVLVSQVPPGYTRRWTERRKNIYYQVDTIIMSKALERMLKPERIIIGTDGSDVAKSYMDYLYMFNCPRLVMSYESAELCKLAINYYLTRQIEATNDLYAIAQSIGANWDDMIPALRLDKRIGAQAYIVPGQPNEHLLRDVRTIEGILCNQTH